MRTRGVGDRVEVPRRVGVGTRLGGEHQIPIAVGEVHHDVGARLTTARAHRMQNQQWRTFELTTHPAVIGPELGDVVRVEIVTVAHSAPLLPSM
jgi:hypothetical protein